ncbi:MAG: aminotransferase class III-fold pyridoxal phosphate-dependent enzyme, partial [Rhodothermia bacterium]|nr:aminotransferase class III-fold pyridoxal phosphate-dependent enzyme [Rhodothermia bacterium]
LTAAAEVVSGYHPAFAVEPMETEVLFPLIQSRLAMSALHAARWRHEHGESDYHLVSENDVRQATGLLALINKEFAHHTFRHACGLEASPHATQITTYLSEASFAPVLSPEADVENSIVFDLSVASSDPGGPDGRLDAARWTRILFDRMTREDASVGVGRYDEARICYSSHQFRTIGGEQRTIHLGIDLFASPGTSVHAPIEGRVHSFRNNDLDLDYGPTIILEHGVPERGLPFYTLYGHLSRSSTEELSVGDQVGRGERIGAIGAIAENGGWPPHLHFQVMSHMYGNEGDFPGVAALSRRAFWTNVCPDPNLILGIPPSAFSPTAMSRGEILESRNRMLASNLSLSYREPLHIVRGFRQYLYDSSGRQYLDCVNNVAHVGHCHPRVVEAASRQMAVLNTNTRYLHENIVRYAERLAASMPGDLRVCFFVNSGSEANDLALRLAHAHTGARDLLVLGSAYHGHLTSLIDVSPYKAERKGGGGLPDHVHRLTTPDVFRGPHTHPATAGKDYADEVATVIARLEEQGRRPAAFIAESVLGCAGQIFPPDRYLALAYEHVRSAGGVCVADEVQIGFGRVGTHFWGFEQQGVIPDIVTLGKPIGNGHPLGAVVTTPEIATSFDNGMEYFNTYGGNPVSCAVGLAVLDVIEEEGLQDHARTVGAKLLADLRALASRKPLIGDVRGSGLFIGIELVRGDDKKPAAPEAAYLVNRMKQNHILLSTDGPDENVIKFKPPMAFSADDAEHLVHVLDDVMRDDFLS